MEKCTYRKNGEIWLFKQEKEHNLRNRKLTQGEIRNCFGCADKIRKGSSPLKPKYYYFLVKKGINNIVFSF